MSSIAVRPLPPGFRLELRGVFPDTYARSENTHDIAITLARDEAVALHAELVAALWNVESRPNESEDNHG